MSEPVDRPTVLNPEAIGDPDQTPIVQLPPEMAAFFERTRCPECRQINRTHADGCRAALDPDPADRGAGRDGEGS